MNEEPIYISIREAGRLLGVSRSTTYCLLKTRLDSARIGRRRLVLLASVRALATEARNG